MNLPRKVMSAAVLLALMGCLGLPPVPTSVKLFDAQNKLVGFVDLLEIKGGVQIRVHTLGMAPGRHGLNIHQNAVCEPPSFASAGPILTARDAKDSVLAGDLPDITAGTTEWSDTTISWPLIRLDKGGRGVFHNGGSSFVVTQEPDNGHASPEASGTRIACGVVKERPEIR